MEAAQVIYSYRGNRGRVQEMSVALFGMSATYQFIGEAPESRFAQYFPLFQALISSFALGTEPAGTRQSATSQMTNQTAIGLYNHAVEHYNQGRFAEAEQSFQMAFNAPDAVLPIKMVAAYARAITLGQLRKPVVIPDELKDKTDETGCTYLAYTIAGHLIRDGHKAAIKKDNTSVVDALIRDGVYRFAFTSFLGNFSTLASRMESGGAIRVGDLAAKPNPQKEDVYANELVQKLRSGAPWPVPIPADGFPESL